MMNHINMKKAFVLALLFLIICACKAQIAHKGPLEIARLVADKIVDNTKFEYQYIVKPANNDAEIIDFGHTYGTAIPAVAYALSTIYSNTEQTETIEVGHTDGLKVWVNNRLAYSKSGNRDLKIAFDEKTYFLPDKFQITLNKGENKILVKSECSGADQFWQVIFQSVNMGSYGDKNRKIKYSLKKYAPDVTLSNWMILGPFENPDSTTKPAIDIIHEPERNLEFYKIYKSGNKAITWDIPRIHIIAANPGGGKFYSWSYHVGGVIWGLQRLSQITKNPKYNNYASRWGNYTLSTISLAEYQTKILHAARSVNWGIAGRPMLDYTTAPSLPFITRLVYEKQFHEREEYKQYADKIMNYVFNEQFRLPSGVFARTYTSSPSVWADDMFMGIPYMLFSAEYITNSKKKQQIYDDVANQITQFSKYLYDKDTKLFHQAAYADQPNVKIPYWSRGNGWAIWAISETLIHLPKSHKDYPAILALYRDHVAGISKTQDEGGYWRNILDLPETVRESSGTAIFTMVIARGINQGWLNRKDYSVVVEKGWKALTSFIDSDGNLDGVKGGTNFSPDPDDYAKSPILKNDTHGILPLLFACFEMDQYQLLNRKDH